MPAASAAASTPTAVLRIDFADPPVRGHVALEGLIADHGGQTHQAEGNGMEAGFPDAAGAVRCAVEIQQHLAALEGDPAADALVWRLAVGLAGDALAPLIAAAAPGEVRITVALHRRVRTRLGLGFAPLEAPAGGFLVLADPATGPQRVWLYRAGPLHNVGLVLVLVLLLLAVAVPLWHLVLAPAYTE